jgi:hypothetical protein
MPLLSGLLDRGEAWDQIERQSDLDGSSAFIMIKAAEVRPDNTLAKCKNIVQNQVRGGQIV